MAIRKLATWRKGILGISLNFCISNTNDLVYPNTNDLIYPYWHVEVGMLRSLPRDSLHQSSKNRYSSTAGPTTQDEAASDQGSRVLSGRAEASTRWMRAWMWRALSGDEWGGGARKQS